MKLKKIDEKIYVNTGIGNVTSVVDATGMRASPWTIVNFVSGSRVDVQRPIGDVVKALETEGPGFGR